MTQPSALGDEVGIEMHGDHIAVVTINRPQARNAINGAVARGLDHIVKQIEADDQIRAAVLTGAGTLAFSAGADLKEVAAAGVDALSTQDGGFAGFVRQPRKKLWIAAVERLAMAGGFEVALACDLLVASEDAVFSLPEVTVGLIAAGGGIYRLPRVLPKALALELIATGDKLDAARAAALGLVNRLAPAGEALTEALALAERICANAPLAVQASLGVARIAFDYSDSELYEMSDLAQAQNMLTEDFLEGPRAFIEKRSPKWRGR
jgi:enoyl-CoA hydratase/carnithine racemase